MSPTEPVVDLAEKTLRHIAEEELRAIPTAERIERVLRILAVRGGANATAVAQIVFTLHPRAKGNIAYSVTTGPDSTAVASFKTIDQALIDFGTTMTLGLEKQIEELRHQADNIERRGHRLREQESATPDVTDVAEDDDAVPDVSGIAAAGIVPVSGSRFAVRRVT